MTDKKSNESRRKLLKSIAAGGGAVVAGKSLPESWSRPVVDSVMLPAHAVTSAYSYTRRETENVNVGRFMKTESNSLLAGLIPDAHAGGPDLEVIVFDYCVDVIGQAWTAAIRLTTEEGCLISVWWTSGTIGSGKQTMEYKLCAEEEPHHITFDVTAADASVAIVKILDGGDPFGPTSIPVGSCPFGDPMAEQCCEIAGDYCGVIGERRGIEITVDPDGEITIAVENSTGGVTAYASVNPFCGGYFDVAFEGTTNRITGTVNCGVPEISGAVTGGQTYTATLGTCD
jgi:hypothetical protein